jgi:hypothetical protein
MPWAWIDWKERPELWAREAAKHGKKGKDKEREKKQEDEMSPRGQPE